MKSQIQSIPSKISEYINSHFKDDFLYRYRQIQKIGGTRCHAIDVSKDALIYHLYFDLNGRLVKKHVEESYPRDEHDRA